MTYIFNVKTIQDTQSLKDQRNQAINRVGIKNFVFPIQLMVQNKIQTSIANTCMYVYLSANEKGTHMSRFIALIHENKDLINFSNIQKLTSKMLDSLKSNEGEINISSTLFLNKIAPISKINSIMNYNFAFNCQYINNNFINTIKIEIPVTSLCPCSKEISEYGAHNQRSNITLTINIKEDIPLDDIIKKVENCASCELFSILKRQDEKYVTEYAYNNPKFVEDIVRDIALTFKKDVRINNMIIESENFESIHNHSAYAKIII